MLINDDDILEYIRKKYTGYEHYIFKNSEISEEKDFVVIKDFHKINEDLIDIKKDVFVRNLQLGRQTNSINIINICDSINAEISGADEEIYAALHEFDKIYTKAFIRNGSRWVALKAFNICCDKAKEIMGNQNPRTLFNISKYTYLLNQHVLNTTNLRLSLVNLRSCLELMHLETRKMNYDMIVRPVTTTTIDKNNETLIKAKYVNNFSLHDDIKFDHEFQVFGTIAGLAARKNRGQFGHIKSYYYQFDLVSTLKKDYSYLNLEIQVKEAIDAPIFVDGKQIAHKVFLKKKIVPSKFSKLSKWTGKFLQGYRFSTEADIYDYTNPCELSSISNEELNKKLQTREVIIVYKIDSTLYDSYGIYDTVNPQSKVIVETGELFNAPYNLFGINYQTKKTLGNLWGLIEHILIFSKTLQSDHIQRIKLFDSIIEQHRNAVIRAEQAEKVMLELHKSNEKIHELNTTLHDKVADRTRKLQIINEERTNAFVNIIHETKTPLTLINNCIDDYVKNNKETPELNIIKNNIHKLSKNINNLFDTERLIKGYEIYDHSQVTNFSEILHDNITLFGYYFQTKELELKMNVENDILIQADPNAINSIINNLLENAIKFSDQNGEINILLETSKEKITFSVSDCGIGIPIELQKKIFEPYYQINTKKKNFQGMGLGLPIVKKIINSLNGQVTINSNPGIIKGTTIAILLDKYQPTQTAGLEITRYPVQKNESLDISSLNIITKMYRPDRLSILVVEDSRAMVSFLYQKFSENYNVEYALNGAEALKKLKEHTIVPDLIIADIMMDVMDGFKFIKVVRGLDDFKHIAIICLSAKTAKKDRLMALKLGAIDFIQKPFSYPELACKIESILKNIANQKQAIHNSIIQSINGLGKQEDLRLEKMVVERRNKNYRLYNLTPKEIEVVDLVRNGLTYPEVAKAICRSEHTVKNHMGHVFAKCEVHSQIELFKKIDS